MRKFKWLIIILFLICITGCAGGYQISFNTMGGQPLEPLTNLKKNAKVSLPIPSKEGHQFIGWFQDENYTIPFTEKDQIKDNLTLYAKWKVKSYRIIFDTDSNTVISPMEIDYGEIIDIPIPTKTGFVFQGWYVDQNLNQRFGLTHMPASNLKLYAKWDKVNYTINYEPNGGYPLSSEVHHYQDLLQLPTPIRQGFKFLGWYINEELTEPFEAQYMPAQNLTLYAKWEQVEYTVKWVLENGQTIEIKYLLGENLVSPPTSKIGYDFLGWYLDDEYHDLFDLGSFPSENITLYGRWEKAFYTITFISDDEVYEELTLQYQESIDLNDPIKEGHTFLGWFYDLEYENSFEMAVPASSITVYAKWEKNQYWVIFHENLGSAVDDYYDYYQSEFELPPITKEGYIFNGWYLDAEFTVQFFGDLKIPAYDLHLYAKWEVNNSLWKYVVRENRIAISGFVGTPKVLDIPSKIDNKIVSRIEEEAFLNFTSLIELYLPDTITYIGNSAFENCQNLQIVKLSTSLTEIAPYTFANCKRIESIDLPEAVIKIANHAFSGCQNLQSIAFPEGLLTIGEEAFRSCFKLEVLNLPSSIDIVEKGAFRDCISLKEINVPNKIIEYQKGVFDNTLWWQTQSDGLIYLGKMIWGYKGILPETINIQVGTLGINHYAFYNSSTLKSVMIPDSVIYIGDWAFAECDQLQLISFNNVIHIGNYAFENCLSLTSIIIPKVTSTIGDEPFKGCRDNLSIYTSSDNVDRLLILLKNDPRVRLLETI